MSGCCLPIPTPPLTRDLGCIGGCVSLGIWFAYKRCADEKGGFYEWMSPTHSHPTDHG